MLRIAPVILLSLLAANLAIAETIAVTSSNPAASEIEAIDLTRHDCARSLAPRLRERLANDRSIHKSLSDETLESAMLAAITDTPGAFEPRVRKVTKSYGDIFFADATIRVDGQLMDRAARDVISAARAHRRLALFTAAGAMLLPLITSIGYVAANALTRGYFQCRLRFAAAAFTLLGLAATVAVYFRLT